MAGRSGQSWSTPASPPARTPPGADGGVAARGRGPTALVVAFALYAALLVLWANRQGPGLSADSVTYYHAAASFITEGQFNAFGMPVTLWPVGYPWLLSLTMAAGIPTAVAVTWLNACCAAATVVLTYRLGRVVTRSVPPALAASGVVAFAPATVRTYSMLWTEPLFTLIAMLVLLNLVDRVRKRHLRPVDMAASAFGISCATLLRFAGVALIPVVIAAVLLSTDTWRRPRRMALALLVGALGGIGLLAVAARNVALGVPPLGPRSSTGLPLVNVAGHSLRAMGRYVIPEFGGLLPLGPAPTGGVAFAVTAATIVIGLALAGGLAAAILLGALRRDRPALVLGIWVVCWWALLWYSSVVAGTDPPEDRLLAPVLPAMAVLFANLWTTVPAHWRQSLRRWVWASAVVWLGIAVSAGLVASTRASVAGIGYNRVEHRQSDLVKAISALPGQVTLAATDPWLVYPESTG